MEINSRIICPACRKEMDHLFKNCPSCNTTVFDEKDGKRIFLDPSKLDRSRKYKVHGLVNGVLAKGYTEFYPGDLVELPDDSGMKMTDTSVNTYIDGGLFNRRFMMPARDIAITTSSSGMMMNAPVRFTGPYGERLRSQIYAPENILGDDEPDPVPQNNPFGLMGGLSLGSMQNLQMGMMNGMTAAPVPPVSGKTWTCSCGSENTGRFCSECGLPMPQ